MTNDQALIFGTYTCSTCLLLAFGRGLSVTSHQCTFKYLGTRIHTENLIWRSSKTEDLRLRNYHNLQEATIYELYCTNQ